MRQTAGRDPKEKGDVHGQSHAMLLKIVANALRDPNPSDYLDGVASRLEQAAKERP